MISSILNPDNYFFNPHCLIFFIPGILIIAEAIFIFWQNKRSMLNFSFALLFLLVGTWLTGVVAMYCAQYEAVAYLWARWYTWFGIIFVTPAVHLFSVSSSGAISVKNKRFIYFNFAAALVVYILCISSPYILQGVWRYPWGFYPRGNIGEAPFLVWFYTLMILSFRNFIRRYKKEKILMRKKQTKLIIIGFTIAFMGSVDFLPTYGIPLYPIGGITSLLFATIIAYTIVRYKLMEIETVIHKTIAWFITSVSLVIPLAALLYYTRHWCSNLTTCGMWGYSIAILVCFLFFVKMLHPKVDAFFQKGRVHLENTLNKFSAELVRLKSVEEVTGKISDTIVKTLYASKVNILLHDKRAKELPQGPFAKWLLENNRVVYGRLIEIDPRYENILDQVKEYFQSVDADICIPLVVNEELIGVVNVGRKKNLSTYRGFELNFLENMKNQMTIAISNSLVYGKVEELVGVRTAELVQAQKQLIQAEKLATVGTLASGIAHEINNPLTSIIMYVNALVTSIIMYVNALANTEGDKSRQESLRSIEECATNCGDIVKKLLTYAREPRGRKKIEDVNLEKSLRNVISFLGYQLKHKNITCDVKADNPPFIVKGYKDELGQVFTNLILNAKDAIAETKKGGNIAIFLSKEGDSIKITIKDDGCGIPQGYISRIFDPFFTTKDVGKGTGLGLSICQSIIEQHKGSISLESVQNQGSTFKITLPNKP